jgi:hypothetical protein
MNTRVIPEIAITSHSRPSDFWSYVRLDKSLAKGSVRYSSQIREAASSQRAAGRNTAAREELPNANSVSNPLLSKIEELFYRCDPYLQVTLLSTRLSELKAHVAASGESDLKAIRVFDPLAVTTSLELIDNLLTETQEITSRFDSVIAQELGRFRLNICEDISASISSHQLEKMHALKQNYETSFSHEQRRLATEAVQNIRTVYEQCNPPNWRILRNSNGRQRQYADLSNGSLLRAIAKSEALIQELQGKAAVLGPKLRIERNQHLYLCGLLRSLASAGQIEQKFKKSLSSSPADAHVASYIESTIDQILQTRFQEGLGDAESMQQKNRGVSGNNCIIFFAQAKTWSRNSKYELLAEALAEISVGLKAWNTKALAEESDWMKIADETRTNEQAMHLLSELADLSTLTQESKAASSGLELTCSAFLQKIGAPQKPLSRHSNTLTPDTELLSNWVKLYSQESMLKIEINEMSRTLFLFESLQKEICQLIPSKIIRSLSDDSQANSELSAIIPLMERNNFLARYVAEQHFLSRNSKL